MIRLLLLAAVLAAPTAKTIYTPFHGSLLKRGISVAATVPGRCTHGSDVAKRWDAWSCVARGRVHDPCFSNDQNPQSPVVACAVSPWSKVTVIELTRTLPQDVANVVGDPRTHTPWALQLTDGTRCVHLLGQPRYRCGGIPVGGLPVRSDPVWRLGDSAIRRAYW